MSESKPKMLMLGPITPSVESVRADRLEYEKLASAVESHRPYEYERMREFWDAAEDSLEERAAAEKLAQQYILMGALALDYAVIPEKRERLSRWYTKATGEVYGVPEPELARKLFSEQQAGTIHEEEAAIVEAANATREYIRHKYQPVLEALDLDNAPHQLNPEAVAIRFEQAIKVLSEMYDEKWAEWVVERDEGKDLLSVNGGAHKVIVGMRRANVTPSQLVQLFAHEVLVHGLRSVNGKKITAELGSGLSGYLDAEEGLGVFMEYAIGGALKDAVIDRYVDVAYAMGYVDGKEHTRAELLELAEDRAIRRNERADKKKSIEDIEKEVFSHVNRIYRGSGGDGYVGVFTKDIAYYQGFINIGRYIADKLEKGVPIDAIIEYVSSGKFDPTNERHVEFVHSKGVHL